MTLKHIPIRDNQPVNEKAGGNLKKQTNPSIHWCSLKVKPKLTSKPTEKSKPHFIEINI